MTESVGPPVFSTTLAIVEQLTAVPGSQVKLRLETEAEVPGGLERANVRTLVENANTLGFVEKSDRAESQRAVRQIRELAVAGKLLRCQPLHLHADPPVVAGGFAKEARKRGLSGASIEGIGGLFECLAV